jgi:hypothetical protein
VIDIASVVEGDGDVRALPNLVHRIAGREVPGEVVRTPTPARLPKSKLHVDGELERFVRLAAGRVRDRGGVLLVFDADDDCPKEAAPALLERVHDVCPDVAVGLVLACREWEAWFLAAASSLVGQRGLPGDLQPPPDAEAVRGAKEWLSARMVAGRSYRETIDQLALTRAFDLDQARAVSGSFDKCYREVSRLLHAARVPQH